jgi:multiple sugar transport system substrate-binding protein
MIRFARRLAAAGVLASLTLTGSYNAVGATAHAAPQITLTVASFYPLDQSSGWSGLVAQFEHDNPGVTIKAQVTAGGPGGTTYLAKILAQKASNTMPDVLGVENSWFATAAADGLLLDITKRLSADKSFNRSQFFPKILDRFTYHDRNYGIPYDAQPIAGFYYNKTLFDQSHVSYPTTTWSWADMMTAAQKLTKRMGSRVVQYGLDPGDGDWRTFVYAYGGRIADDYRNPKTVVLDSARATAGVDAYVSLFKKGQQVAPTPNLSGSTSTGLSSSDLFVAGKTAMYIAGYWEYVFNPQKYSQIKLGYAPIPAGPHGDRGYATGGTCYGVSSGSKHADLAFKFVQYFMGLPGWRAAYQAAPFHGIYPPAYYPAYNSTLFLHNPHPPVQNGWINGWGAQYALFNPNDPNWVELDQKTLEPAINTMVLGQTPVAATLKHLTPQLTAGLSAHQHQH